jgi:hypothetical protein
VIIHGLYYEQAQLPPNGLPFSRRKRIATSCQIVNDLVRAAVGWNGVLAGSFARA